MRQSEEHLEPCLYMGNWVDQKTWLLYDGEAVEEEAIVE